jgi:hypothetical protein
VCHPRSCGSCTNAGDIIEALPEATIYVMILPADTSDITAADLVTIKKRANGTGTPIVYAVTPDGKSGHAQRLGRVPRPLSPYPKTKKGRNAPLRPALSFATKPKGSAAAAYSFSEPTVWLRASSERDVQTGNLPDPAFPEALGRAQRFRCAGCYRYP